MINGFLWLMTDPLRSFLADNFRQCGIDFYQFDFPGHWISGAKILWLEEMVDYAYDQYLRFWADENTAILWFSQWWAVATKMVLKYWLSHDVILIAPMFFSDNLIERRLTESEVTVLGSGKTIQKDFWLGRIHQIDARWLASYRSFLNRLDLEKLTGKVVLICPLDDKTLWLDHFQVYKDHVRNITCFEVEWANHVFASEEARIKLLEILRNYISDE